MLNALIGQKLEQTQKFLENGRRIPVTKIALSDNAVLQIKTIEKDKYAAVQLGFGIRKKTIKSLAGHAKKAKLATVPVVIREVPMPENTELQAGDMIAVEAVFKPGDVVAVTGTSKGKGFAGVVKRHGFHGGPKTHGQSDRHRAPGSIGQTTTPGRVYRGKRMAGHMGTDTVTVQNLVVVDVDAANKKLYVAGLVPGHVKSYIFITRTGEKKKFVPLLKREEKTASNTTEVEAVAAVEKQAENGTEETKGTEVEQAVKEMKSDVEDGEKKAPGASEKGETKEAAAENVASEEKK